MRRTLAAALALLLLSSAAAPARGQSSSTLGETIERVGSAYARLYVQPVVDAVGAGVNSGFVHTAGVGGGLLPGVDLYLGVKAFGVFVPEEDRSLSLEYRTVEAFTYQGTTYEAPVTYRIEDAPTAFGEEESGLVTAEASYETADGRTINETTTLETLPGVLNASVAPLAVPQAGIGVPLLNTQLTVRYLPRISYRDYGSVRLLGAGLRHEISAYLPALPFDLSVQGFYQNISVEEADGHQVVDATMLAGNLAASKTLAVVTFYGGLQLERTTADLAYTFVPDERLPPQQLAFDLTGDNTVRALAGLSLGLGPVVLSVDYSQGQRSVLSTGLGFGF